MISIKRKVEFVCRAHGKKTLSSPPTPPPTVAPGRVPRVSRLMALAIHFDRLIREGRVADVSQAARLCQVTQPRMTQIMNLNHLAPDIQEELLLLPLVTVGRPGLNEKMLRPVAAQASWQKQRQMWRRTVGQLVA